MILGTISRWWECAVEELPHLIVDRKPWERQGLGPKTAFIVTPQRTPKVGERAPFSCLFHNLRKEQDRVRRQVLKTPDYRGRFPSSCDTDLALLQVWWNWGFSGCQPVSPPLLAQSQLHGFLGEGVSFLQECGPW